MTRINLVPPEELMDQHLFAEFREIKMVPKSLSRSLKARGAEDVLKRIPPAFTLNTGHVSFFYDKGKYLRKRYELLKEELEYRGLNFNRDSLFDPDGTFESLGDAFNRDYEPTEIALELIRKRIIDKIAMKPLWYRYSVKG